LPQPNREGAWRKRRFRSYCAQIIRNAGGTMGKLIVCAVFAVLASTLQSNAQQNVILFAADGLRAAAVTPERAPAFAQVRDTGVNFSNSHSVYPTITTANASVIATGHLVGDTGDFGNTFYTG